MGPGKSLELPPPLEFTELHRLPPPSKSARKIAATTPPSNLRNFIDYPPRSKSARKIAPTTPPLEFTELHRLPPPLEIGPENRHNHNYPPPPRIHGTSSTTPPLEIEPPFSEPWLRPWSNRYPCAPPPLHPETGIPYM